MKVILTKVRVIAVVVGLGTLLQGVQASVQALREAVRQGDASAVHKALGGLKAPYARLFVKFG